MHDATSGSAIWGSAASVGDFMSSVGSGRDISQTSSKTWFLVSDGAGSTFGSWRRGVRNVVVD